MSSESTDEITREQRLRGFSHFTTARLFLQGYKIYDFDPDVAKKFFKQVTDLDPHNPYGWIYYLFTLEDTGASLRECVETCNKLVEVSDKKKLHGLDGLSKQMMVEYIKKVEKIMTDTKETFIN
ncbi:MAG TPA: hypothetical protein PLW50_00145 [Smithellaceae bacterium]|nr:hypothetical protein [Smithellaceae bacterium]